MTVYKGIFDLEMNFTDTYIKFHDEHIAIREAMCLKVLNPANMRDIRDGDLFAGRTEKYPLVGFSLEEASGGPIYYCWEDRIREKMQNQDLPYDYCARVEDMLTYWKQEATNNKFNLALTDELRQKTRNFTAGMFGRLSGITINFEKLVAIGITGLQEEIESQRFKAIETGGDVHLYEGMLLALDLFKDNCRYYSSMSKNMAEKSSEPAVEKEFLEISAILERLILNRPETFREAAQLCWLFALISGVVNYGRMDIYLGDLYAKDIDSGLITEDKALELLKSLWQLIADRKIAYNSRVIVGGKGRKNEANADRFALAAMEATRLVIETEPQFTLRFYKGMNPALMKKALDVIGEGRIYPMLYNDDVNIPAVQNAFRVDLKEAEQYYPYGCGEYGLDHISFGSPNSSFNPLKALELTLHNGLDIVSKRKIGLELGEFLTFKTFEELFEAYKQQVEYFVDALAERDAIENKIKTETASFLYCSMLTDSCIERGKSITGGGIRYLGAVIEAFGLVNAADSLTAIKELVYDKKLMTQQELLEILDANFVGYENKYQLMLDVPKYGNDEDSADLMVQKVSDHLCRYTRSLAIKIGFDFYLIVNINNNGNVSYGKNTAASAEGRKNGEPLANGNTPTAGRDKNGVTAFLNSIVKVDPSVHAGYVHNMKFCKQMFTTERLKLEALLEAYFDNGGTQAMITCVNKGDLENAMEEPDKYKNLIVRVGGFSARFVELSKDLQIDILNRTLY